MDCLRQTRAVLPRYCCLLCVSIYLLLSGVGALSQAQVRTNLTPDGTLGTTVTQRDSLYTITGGTRPGNGPNVFHSFDRLSVGTGDTASFTGPVGIMNILSRVTGTQQSVIDGTLQSTASLYLINPRGVIFGPNASLDLSGSFHVSTADYLRLADGAIFSAHLSKASTLSVAPPVAFGFLEPIPASIVIQDSTLQVSAGQTLSVIGGNIALMGSTLAAPSGQINLASVATAGELGVHSADSSAPLQTATLARFGRVDLVDTHLDVSGPYGGTVMIRGGHLMMDNTVVTADTQGDVHGARVGLDIRGTGVVVLTNGTHLSTNVGGAGNAGSIQIAADSLDMRQASLISSQSAVGTTGDVGSIDITARLMQVMDGSRISGDTHGIGRGGTLTVTIADTLTMGGYSPTHELSGLSSSTFGGGAAGRIGVQASRFTLQEGAEVTSNSFSTGPAGRITVDVGTLQIENALIATRSDEGSTGDAGDT